MVEKFGYCADGHLHKIKSEFVKIAETNKPAFESGMFTNEELSEEIMRNENLIPLEPTNCPNIEGMLPFGRLAQRRNVLPYGENIIFPYSADEVDEQLAVSWLLSFEEHPDRLSETKEVGKSKLFELIAESCPELHDDDIAHMTYETLREKFLRKFWSLEYQNELFLRLIASSYPFAYADNQTVRDYVFDWLERFTFSTAYTTRNILHELMKTIPPDCAKILKPLLAGCKMYHVYEVVNRNEHIFNAIYDRIQPRRREWLQGPFLMMILGLPVLYVYWTFFKYLLNFSSYY